MLKTMALTFVRRDRHAGLFTLGTALVLGSLSTVPADAQTPQLVSVTPANGTTNAALNSSLVFVFDQPMDTDVIVIPSFPPFLIGNLDISRAGHYTDGSWSADGRTLTCVPSVPLPADANVTWTLNPAGSAFPFASASGTPLATVSGSFKTTSGGGGTNECDPRGLPSGWGSYSVTKNLSYDQVSSADPLPSTNSPFLFGVFVNGPSAGPAVSAGSITLPDSSRQDLQGFFGLFTFSETAETESALDTAYPSGSYTLRFTQTGQPERVIPMTMPATKPPVPKIENFTEAQAVNAAQDFTLRWGAFTGAAANDYLRLMISDDPGTTVFQAPDYCVPRTLAVTATSIVIPANTLQTNKTYTASLSFGAFFHFSTNAVPEMSGVGSIVRSTSFTIKTGTGGGPGLPNPANLAGARLLSNGNPEISLSGTATRTYTVERTGSLSSPNWMPAGTVTMDAGGNAVFQDTQPNKTFPLFYRAVGN
jgi:hypothetical protein